MKYSPFQDFDITTRGLLWKLQDVILWSTAKVIWYSYKEINKYLTDSYSNFAFCTLFKILQICWSSLLLSNVFCTENCLAFVGRNALEQHFSYVLATSYPNRVPENQPIHCDWLTSNLMVWASNGGWRNNVFVCLSVSIFKLGAWCSFLFLYVLQSLWQALPGEIDHVDPKFFILTWWCSQSQMHF